MGAGYDPIIGTELDYLRSNWLCRYWASLKLTHMTYEVQRDPAALQHITHIFSSPPAGKGVWLWWLEQVCALIHRGCCCFSRAYQGVTVPLIYGYYWSSVAYRQLIISLHSHTSQHAYCIQIFKKERKKQLDFLGPKNSSDLLRRVKKNTPWKLSKGLFLPFSNCAQMSTPPKKETNLNVKVSIINHLGERGHPASPGSLLVCWQQTKCHAPWWVCGGGLCGRYLTKWDTEFEYVCGPTNGAWC